MTYGCGKSDSAILAGKPTNKAEQSAAESVEQRVEAKGNTGQQSTYRAQDREKCHKRWTAYAAMGWPLCSRS